MNAPDPRIPPTASTVPTVPTAYGRIRSGRLQGWQPDYPGAALRRLILWTVGAVVLGLVVLLAAQVPTMAQSAGVHHKAAPARSSGAVAYDTVGPTEPLPTPPASTLIPQIVEATGTMNYNVTLSGQSTSTTASQTNGGTSGGSTGGTSGGTKSGGHGKHKHGGPPQPPTTGAPTSPICAIIVCVP